MTSEMLVDLIVIYEADAVMGWLWVVDEPIDHS